mgnify:CR=1 FL=1
MSVPYDRWPAWALEAERLGWGDPASPMCDPELAVTVDGYRPHYQVSVTATEIVFTDTLAPGRVITFERGWLARASLHSNAQLVPVAPASRGKARAR